MIKAILVLGLGLSVAGCGESDEVGRYQMLNVSEAAVARLDTKTGDIKVCRYQIDDSFYNKSAEQQLAAIGRAYVSCVGFAPEYEREVRNKEKAIARKSIEEKALRKKLETE
jgi:hypothetical protein